MSASDFARLTKSSEEQANWAAQLTVLLILYAIGWSIGWTIRQGMAQIDRDIKKYGRVVPNYVRVVIGAEVGLPLILAILYTAVFMQFVYPTIPAQFGGGRPQTVRILFSPDASHGLKEIGMPLEPRKDYLSVPVELVHEANNAYVVRLPDQRIMRIDKKLANVLIDSSEREWSSQQQGLGMPGASPSNQPPLALTIPQLPVPTPTAVKGGSSRPPSRRRP
jgi:hypothetical protein